MTVLTPQEAFQAIADGKDLEYRWKIQNEWRNFNSLASGVNIECVFTEDVVFRLAQEMITIGNVSFPKPESKPPKQGSYYIASLKYDNFYAPSIWDGDALDKFRLKCGLVHLSKENAIAHTKALIKLSGGKVDE